MALKVKVTNMGADVYLEVEGILDETGSLPDIDANFPGRVIVNLAKLTMINSLGCRNWLKWIKSFSAKGGVTLIQCSPPFVSQVNILHGFIPPGVTIESVFVPYFCESCQNEEQILFLSADNPANAPDHHPCAKCKSLMEIDVVKSMYFRFWKKSA